MDSVPIPPAFDGYRIVKRLGVGGMGEVYLGHDTLLDRPVAVKIISAATPTTAARQRFLVEARAIARLNHPCVVAVYRAGEHDGRPYIVSEFVEGESLDMLPHPMPWRDVLVIGHDLARGLAVAHQAGVVHRDIKPANAMLARDGTAKLLDFGIARFVQGDSGLPSLASGGKEGAQAPAGDTPLLLPLDDEPATVDVELPERVPDHARDDESVGRLTGPGKAMGTPRFMAPEVWLGATATYASDVYSLGALLYTLCAGHPPHMDRTTRELRRKVTSVKPPALASLAPDVDPDFARIVETCLAIDVEERYRDADEVRAALLNLLSPAAGPVLPEGNPYRGLRPFEADHQALFFGRDMEIRALLDRLREEPVVIVTGESGVGKSSLCRAGVLTRAPQHIDAALTWSVVTVVPGRRPVETICAALAAESALDEDSLLLSFKEGPSTFSRRLRQTMGPSRGVLLFIDQLEELVTQSSPQDGEAIARLLAWTSNPIPGFRILATVRSDFLGPLAAYPQLGDVLSSLISFLRPLSTARLREAVLAPAKATGISFESEEMVESLVESTAGAGGALPLLQFTLHQLWERRDQERHLIPASALEELGGVAGALSAHADDVLKGLGPSHRSRVRRILLNLVTSEGTRACRTRAELTAGLPRGQETLDALVRGRLVVAVEAGEEPSYEVSHEALLKSWGTLLQWLSADVEQRIVHARLTASCREWERLGRSREALWTGRQLEEARLLSEVELTPVERAFLRASVSYARRAHTLRRAGLLAVLLAVLATYAGMQYVAYRDLSERIESRLEAGKHAQALARALAQQLGAAESRALGHFDSRNPLAGEEAWDEAQRLRAGTRETLGRAGREMEAAVALDPNREEPRTAFAQILFDRALEAEARHAVAEQEEFLMRLELYDTEGEFKARWRAPAILSVTAEDAPGATVSVARYVLQKDRTLVEETVHEGQSLPLEKLELPPGSYLLSFRVPGNEGPPVLLPVRLWRGRSREVTLRLGPAEAAPPGFAYVPGGRFLFGSAEEDGLRRGFHHTVPLHEVSVGPYYIARHETTFGEWLEYLDQSPPEVLPERLPTVHAGGFEGALSLKRDPDHVWRLEFKPTATRYQARVGEMITYPARTVRRKQDWLRFPVVGITAAQAEAYARWLDETGRLAGARLCTDQEWEFAARGADGREYPQGYSMTRDAANFDATYDKEPAAMGPDMVGSHPASRSPFGLDDTSGNVWEWTVSSVEAHGHAARGGSFYFDINTARTHNRETPEPSFRDTSVGFRLCADLSREESRSGAAGGVGTQDLRTVTKPDTDLQE